MTKLMIHLLAGVSEKQVEMNVDELTVSWEDIDHLVVFRLRQQQCRGNDRSIAINVSR